MDELRELLAEYPVLLATNWDRDQEEGHSLFSDIMVHFQTPNNFFRPLKKCNWYANLDTLKLQLGSETLQK